MLFMVYPHMIPTKTPPPNPQSSQNPLLPPASYAPGQPGKEGPSGVGSLLSTASAAAKAERYRPKIFGFQVHEVGKLQRWQEGVRDK